MPLVHSLLMQLNRLWYFYVIAQSGSVTAAAKRLRIGQPAVSRALKGLEEELGSPLLERSRQGVHLTAFGARVLQRCETIFQEVAQIQDAADATSDAQGDFVIVTSEHVATYLLPAVLARLSREFPRVTPRVFTGPTHLLLPQLEEGTAHVGLFFKVPRRRSLRRRALATLPCKVVVAPAFRRDKRVLTRFIGSREVNDLRNRDFPTVTYLRKKRPETRIQLSCNSLEAHKRMVMAGCGISVLPTFVMRDELERGDLVLIHPNYTYEAKLQQVQSNRAVATPLKNAFQALMENALASHAST